MNENIINIMNAEEFMEAMMVTDISPKSVMEKLKFVIIGSRNHNWMYDGRSLCKLLDSCGFENPTVMNAGLTMIPESGELNLMERSPESVFVEAIKP